VHYVSRGSYDKGGPMRFRFLIHGDDAAEAALTADERRAIVSEHMVLRKKVELRATGICASRFRACGKL
jgi:hypothetical protein